MKYDIEQFQKDIQEPYAWPGGYPRFFVMHDGEALSFQAAQENQSLLELALKEDSNDGWRVVACEINWENHELYCCHSNKLIESAYALTFSVLGDEVDIPGELIK